MTRALCVLIVRVQCVCGIFFRYETCINDMLIQDLAKDATASPDVFSISADPSAFHAKEVTFTHNSTNAQPTEIERNQSICICL